MYERRDEFNTLPFDAEYSMPTEERLPVEDVIVHEDVHISDTAFAYDEFNQNVSAPVVAKSRHNLMKHLFMKPVVAVIMTLSVIHASFNVDPLGEDFLNDTYRDIYNSHIRAHEVDDIDPDGIVTTYVHVTYVPTGESYSPDYPDEEGLEDAKIWVSSLGGDPDTMVRVDVKIAYTGTIESDDAIIVGDRDDMDSAYIPQGTVVKTYRKDVYYEAYEESYIVPASNEKADKAFPKLSNLDPDFDGEYAWGEPNGKSEEYVRFTTSHGSPYSYLVMGEAWEEYGYMDENGEFVANELVTVSGASYDSKTNTLTLRNFTASELDINLMGNGFKIKLVGDNYLDKLTVWGAYYGGSVTITGDGSLTINESGRSPDGVGLNIQGEWSQSCLMIDKKATLDVYGDYAIVIGATTMKQAIYYLSPVVLTGGVRSNGQFVEYSSNTYDSDGNYLGSVSTTLEEISAKEGVDYYDYSVVDEDGNPATHVRFAPKE